MEIKIPLEGLGMSAEAMLELVNRMNKYDPERKYVLEFRSVPPTTAMAEIVWVPAPAPQITETIHGQRGLHGA
jgi:hypothetical protein